MKINWDRAVADAAIVLVLWFAVFCATVSSVVMAGISTEAQEETASLLELFAPSPDQGPTAVASCDDQWKEERRYYHRE